MDHLEALRIALLEMAKRPHLTGGDDLVSARIVAIGRPMVCWDVYLGYQSAGTFRVSMGSSGENASVENILDSLYP